MPSKLRRRLLIDLILAIILIELMAFSPDGEELHEYLGVGFIVVLISHLIFQSQWLRKAFVTPFPSSKLIKLIVFVLLFIATILQLASGLQLASHLPLHLSGPFSTTTARSLHMGLAYWTLCLAGIHVGLHSASLSASLHLNKLSTSLRLALRSIVFLLAVYGLHALIYRDVLSYMFMETHFASFDDDELRVFLYIDLVSMVTLWATLAHYALKLLPSRKR
jgi:hypothetical protein